MVFQREEGMSASFHLIKKHVVDSPIKMVSMCSTMDLIAVCSVSGSVWVARWYNSLEKIWLLSPSLGGEEKVETLAWRSDGKVIAIGYSNGTIRLYNVDSAEMVHELIQKPSESSNSLRLTCAGISCLHWVRETCVNLDHMFLGQQVVI
ncbi:12743_t:CDS:2 [Acaulospora colombiana]|uniref:12743_t:CDS:1 n=1 Tax=Acaulospora colombiana TaxID=27376 RepID=A0ACA9LJS1_9GLOM|nr:12743_t:CDS:2 [Acaulospora colombiana]